MQSAGIEPFPFHDLKSKGISDHEQNFGGHRSPAMRRTYVRTLQATKWFLQRDNLWHSNETES